MDGEAGWWTTSGNIGLSPLARVMGVGRQQQQQGMEAWQDDKTSHSLINHMTHRLSTPDAGTLPVHQTSHYVPKIYTASQ